MNTNSNYYFTSESVTEGHPDKICDQISDAIVDDLISQDRDSRVACETFVTTGLVLVAGEISTKGFTDIPKIVRRVIKNIGYTSQADGFNSESCAILTSIDEQSSDIAAGIENPIHANKHDSLGAGDQGMMFGYACNETPELMPLAISLAHKLAKQLSNVRKSGKLNYLKPDGKSQVTIQYRKGIPYKISNVVISCHHSDDVRSEQIEKDVIKHVVKDVLNEELLKDTSILVNPTGRFVIGGPQGDSGLTGRKIIVDTYGGYGRHGGGAFSGKDPTKVDRSAAYAARYIAKNIVASGLAQRCEIQLAYAIGVSEPISVNLETFGTGKKSEELLVKAIRELFPITPYSIINEFDLKRPIYQALSAYGHMGREELAVPWENTNKVEQLLEFVKDRH